MASGGAATLVILSRMVEAAPVISSTVSPRTRSAIKSPPICEGVASPDIMRSKAPAASSVVRDWPAAALAISPLRSSLTTVSSMGSNPASRRTTFDATAARGIPPRGQIEEILQQQMAVLGGDALGMKLHAVHGPRLVRKPHDQAVIGFGGDAERVRKAIALDHQRMVARRLERAVDAAEHAFAAMAHLAELAVHRLRRAHHLAAERLADGLMAETDAEDRHARRGVIDQIEADAGLVRRAGAGRQHDCFWLLRQHVLDRNLVVAM